MVLTVMQVILRFVDSDVHKGDIVDMKEMRTVDSINVPDIVNTRRSVMHTAITTLMYIDYDMLKLKVPKLKELNSDECIL